MPPESGSPFAARRVRAGGVELNVEATGAGIPVLLLHGFPDSLRLWREVAPRLVAAGHRVIALDQRGFGESDAPWGVAQYRLERLLEDVTGLLPLLGVREPVHVLGHDWGAVVAWGLAMRHPQLVRSCVVLSVGHPREYLLAGLEQKRKGLYVLGWQFPGLAERWLAAGDFARLRLWLRQHPDPEDCLRDLRRPGRLTAGLNWYRANLVTVLYRQWPTCAVPVLGAWGSEDHCLAEDQMARSGRRVSGPWRYTRLEGAGHWLPLERPDEVAGLAADWFGRHRRQ